MKKRAFSRLAKIVVTCTLLVSMFNNVVIAAGSTTTSSASVLADPTKFIAYEGNNGSIYYDPANEPGKSPDEVDFTSGNDKGTGDKPSFYVYGDNDYLYFRMRLLGNPYDRKGGFLSTVWNFDILVGGTHKATVVLDGKSPHTDYLYVADPTKTNLVEVSRTDSTGQAVPGTNITNAENGHYFLDVKVPYTSIAQMIPNLDKATPNVSFSFSTSKSANLRVINKDGMDEATAGSGAMVKLSPFAIYKPTITFADVTTYENINPTITGTTTNAANGSTVKLQVNNKEFTGTVTGDSWSIVTDLPVGVYDAIATVTNEKGNKATTTKTIKVGTLISIDGPSVEKVYKYPSTISGKFVNTTGGSKKVQFTIKKDVSGTTQVISTYNNIQADNTTKKWEKTGVSLPAAHGVGTYPIVAVEDTNGSNLPTATKTIVVIPGPTITTPVIENGKLVVKGTAEKGETVEVYIDGTLYKTVLADATTGNWSIDVDKLLSTGPHNFQAKAKDDYGAEANSTVVSYTVTAISVNIANGDQTTTNDPTPTIYGKTSVTNNGKVKLSIDGGTEVVVDVVDGKWVYPVAAPLTEGKHAVRAVAVEGQLTSEPDTQELTVDTITVVSISTPTHQEVKNSKAITITGTGEAGGVVTLVIDQQPEVIIPLGSQTTWTYTPSPELAYGVHNVTVKGMDELGNTKKVDGTEATVTHTFTILDPTKPIALDDEVFTAKNQPKSGTLQVTDQHAPLNYQVKTTPQKGTVTIDSFGNWSYQPNPGVTGTDTFEIEVTNDLENSDTATVTVHIVDLAVDIDAFVPSRTADHTPTFTGSVVQTPDSQLKVQILTKAGLVVHEESVTADSNGKWQITSPQRLEAGDYQVKAILTDAPLNGEEQDVEDFTVYNVNDELDVTATPERVIADGYSVVEVTGFLKDMDTPLRTGVANSWVTFTTEEGTFVAKPGQVVSNNGRTIKALTDSTGLAKVDLLTPDYTGLTESKTKEVVATAIDEEKGLNASDDFYLTFVPAIVTGKVVNALTGESIPNATIKVQKTFDDQTTFTYTGTTDSNGNYQFPVSRGNTTYEVVVDTTIIVEGTPVPVTFTQLAEVSLVPGLVVETEKAEHVVSGKVLVYNKKTNEVKSLSDALGQVNVVAEIKDADSGMQVTPTNTGEYVVTGGVVNKTYSVLFKIKDVTTNQLLAGKKVTITIPEDGKATILPILIDPYGKVTDKDSGLAIEGASVKLYWADTERNHDLGRTPHTLVSLPGLTGFTPNHNLNPQSSTNQGLYAWMVYPEGDYYIVATKPGYKEYNSLTEARNSGTANADSYVENGVIKVGYTIVNYDFEMEKLPLSVSIDGGAKWVTPDRTPVLTGDGAGATNGKVKVTIKDSESNMVESAEVSLTNGKWSYSVSNVLNPSEYVVEAVVKDTVLDRVASTTKPLVIEKVEFQIDLTATPESVVADGETIVILTAKLSDKNGQPLVGETVYFQAEAGELQSSSATTNAQGGAVVTLIAPNFFGNTETITKSITASVNNPDKGLIDEDHVSIHFVPATVTGRVVDATTGQPVSGATVTIDETVDGVLFQKTVTTGADGSYVIIVPKGNHDYNLLITKQIEINGVQVPVSYSQSAKVGQVSGEGEEFISEKAIVGQLLMTDSNESEPKLITDIIEGATYHAELVGGNGNVVVNVNEKGQYIVTGGEVGESYQIYLTIQVADDNGVVHVLAGQQITISIPEEGVVAVEATLIDPYGTVTDKDTGKAIEGVDMQLYWADTELNRELGRTPNTLVELPILADFQPNQNRNKQFTNVIGEYAWMVFANGDYYILAKKEGYVTYDSRSEGRNGGNPLVDDSYITNGIIHVGQTIVKYDLSLSKSSNPVKPDAPVTPVLPSTPVTVSPVPTVLATTIENLPKTGSWVDFTLLMQLAGIFLFVGIALTWSGRRREKKEQV